MGKKRLMNRKKSFAVNGGGSVTDCIDFIESSLKDLGIDRKLILKTVLLAEEMIALLIKHGTPDAKIHVRVKRLAGDAAVTLSCEGAEFDPYSYNGGSESLDEMEDEEAQTAIRSILLRSQGEMLKITHRNGTNRVRITAGQAERSMLIATVVALILGLIAGALLKFVIPQNVSGYISDNILVTVKDMFMSALKIVISPVVFFSLVTCVSQFKNIAELGKIGAKVMGTYFLTTAIAVMLAIGLFFAIKPGTEGFAMGLDTAAQTVDVDTEVDTSIIVMIKNIVPSNFIEPFLNSDTLQLIFLAVLCGIAVGAIGEYSETLKNIFEALNSLFLKITTIISGFIPLAVFCSVALMFYSMGGSSFVSVMGMGGTHILCIMCMLVVYGLIALILGRANPLKFYRKNREGMMTSFLLGSSAAAIPVNIRICTEKLGISPKVCNFSIPLGATVNMDGTSIFLAMSGLFLARAYSVEVTPSMLVTLVITIIMLSIGAPGVPGSSLLCLSVILNGLGVPVESIGLVIGIYPLMNMFNTMSNTTGDVTTALIVARSEKLLDRKKLNER